MCFTFYLNRKLYNNRIPLRRPSVDKGISDWHNELVEMMFETGYREFMLQNPYMITVDSDAKQHISYFFVRPWWGDLEWGCQNKRLQYPKTFAKQCPNIECQNDPNRGTKCNQCIMLPFTSPAPSNILCATTE